MLGRLLARDGKWDKTVSADSIAYSVEWPAADSNRMGELRPVRVLVTDVGPIRDQDVMGLMHVVGQASEPLLLVAPAFTPGSLLLMASRNIFPVQAGDVGVERMDELLADFSFLTGARLMSGAVGMGLDPAAEPGRTAGGLILPGLGWAQVKTEDLGRANSLVITPQMLTVHVSPPRGLDGYLQGLLVQFKCALDDADRECVARRFARFGRSPDEGPVSDMKLKIPSSAILVPGGYVSPFFITDPEHGLVDLAKPRVLVLDCELPTLDPLTVLADEAVRQGVPLVVVARSMGGAALAFLVVNKLRGVLAAAAVRVSGTADPEGNSFRKVVQAIGGRWVRSASELGVTQLSELGRAERVLAGRSWTIVIP